MNKFKELNDLYGGEENRLKSYNETDIKASLDDMRLDDIIASDMMSIWKEVGGQDGMYDNFPIVRFFRGENGEPHRSYALDSDGGFGIIAYLHDSEPYYNHWKVVTLGEDDGFHFLNGADLYCSYYGQKADFLTLLSEAISIMNNNI